MAYPLTPEEEQLAISQIGSWLDQGQAPSPEPVGPAHAPPPAYIAPQAAVEREQAGQAAVAAGAPPPKAPAPPPPPPGNVTLPAVNVTPGPISRGGPPQPPVPDELQPGFGGRYYPMGDGATDYLSEVETARLRGDITDEQARQLRAGYETTIPGLRTQGARLAVESGQVGDELATQHQQAEADAAQSIGRLQAERAAFERQEAIAERRRHEAFQRGVARHEERMAAADQAVKDYRIQDRRDPVTRIVHGIAAALGALGAGLAKTPNFALQQIEAQIERDMRSQEQELSGLREGRAQARSDLSAYYQHFGDMEKAKDALRARYYREHAAKAAEVMALTQNKRAKAALAYIADNGNLRAEQIDLGLKQTAALEQAQIAAQAQAAQPQQEVGPFEWFDVSDDMAKLYVPEAGGFVSSSDEKKEIASKLSYVSKIDQIAGQMEALIQQSGTKGLAGKARGQLITLQGELHRAVAQAGGQGAIGEGEAERYNAQIPAGTSLTTMDSTALAQLRALRGMAKADQRNVINAYGVRPGILKPTRDQKGKLKWQAGFVQPSEEIQQERFDKAVNLAGRGEQ